MKARAVRLHGANDLRLDEFELPAIKEDEILVIEPDTLPLPFDRVLFPSKGFKASKVCFPVT